MLVKTAVLIDPEVFRQWLEKHWKGPKLCPTCSTNNWHVGDIARELRTFQQPSDVFGGAVVPLAALTCLTCGHTLLFNALIAGLVDPQ